MQFSKNIPNFFLFNVKKKKKKKERKGNGKLDLTDGPLSKCSPVISNCTPNHSKTM